MRWGARYNRSTLTSSQTAMQQTASPSRRNGMRILAAIVILALLVIGYLSWSKRDPAPDVVFTNLQGERISSQDLRGKVFMVNFWATSCTTCVAEMPEMVETYNKFKDKGFDFFAVAMSYDPPNYVLNFAETRQLPFNVAIDAKGDIAQAFGDVKLTPTTFVIDKQGQIVKRYVGEPDFQQLHQLLEKELTT
jgi:peroxiredoxin